MNEEKEVKEEEKTVSWFDLQCCDEFCDSLNSVTIVELILTLTSLHYVYGHIIRWVTEFGITRVHTERILAFHWAAFK